MSETKYSKSFDALLKESSNQNTRHDGLNFKTLLKAKPHGKDNRKLSRINFEGIALVFDLNGELITKAKFKNMSAGGIGIEAPSVEISPNSLVQIVLGGEARKLGVIDCFIKWVKTTQNHKKIGLEVSCVDEKIKNSFKQYVQSLASLS